MALALISYLAHLNAVFSLIQRSTMVWAFFLNGA